MNYIGDKTQFENSGLDEPETEVWICPICGFKKDIIVQYDLHSEMFYPVSWKDTECDICKAEMEKEERK